MTISDAIQKLMPKPEETLERFSGNQEFLEMFVRKFPEDETIPAVREACQGDDWQKILAAVHTLKGTSGNFGFEALFNACSTVVTAIRAQDYDGARANIPNVLSELDTVCNILAQVE
ncbi:MAG: Hpt domain-containing protein [Treponema sp.]|nr:Hpt domain-containing protein [Treponema sp.]